MELLLLIPFSPIKSMRPFEYPLDNLETQRRRIIIRLYDKFAISRDARLCVFPRHGDCQEGAQKDGNN